MARLLFGDIFLRRFVQVCRRGNGSSCCWKVLLVMYWIFDDNLAGSQRVGNKPIASSPFSDVAEIIAYSYAQTRYGYERSFSPPRTLRTMRPIRVVNSENNEELIRYGLVRRPTIGKVRKP